MFRDATWPLPALAVRQLTSAGITRYLFFRSRSEGRFLDDLHGVQWIDPILVLEGLKPSEDAVHRYFTPGASGARYLAPSSGVLIDKAENLLVGLALDDFDLIANEMHCIHAWWRGEGYTYLPDTKSDIHSIARQAAASWSHVSMYARAQRYVAIPPTRVSTVTDLRNAELKGEGGRGDEKGEGGRLCQFAWTGRRGGYNIVVILGK